jgi:hypothetical protein
MVVVVLLIPVFFEVAFNPQFALPRTVQRPDVTQEDRYEQCVAMRTDEATREALEAADNPDVQSLMIRMRQKAALADCRTDFPQQQVDVDEPLRINLLDFRWRF